MARVIEYLEKFNRKERYWLLREALGDESKNPFTLSDGFRERLQSKCGLSVPIPKDAFVAMDYHLDWIKMALLWGECDEIQTDCDLDFPPELSDINKNQEDIDLLIAFEERGKTHLVLIEAKADTGWTNKQLDSKVGRLEKMFEDHEGRRGDVEHHLVLMSPKNEPQKLSQKRHWIKMSVRGCSELLKGTSNNRFLQANVVL